MIDLGPCRVTSEQFAAYLESYPPTLLYWQQPIAIQPFCCGFDGPLPCQSRSE